MLDALFSPCVICVQYQLDIRRRGRHLLALCYQLLDQVLAIIDARIGCDPDLAVQAERLMLTLGLPGSPQHRMTEADVTVDPHALRVRTPDRQVIGHRFEQPTLNRCAVQIDYADYPTHFESRFNRKK